MRLLTTRRAAVLCAGLGAVGAVVAFTVGGTSALFTSSADAQNNTITAGTVALTQDVAQSRAIDITGYMPGDGSCYSAPTGAPYTCNQPRNNYYLKYSGDDAFVGLDFTVSSTASSACTALPASSSVSPADVSSECTDVGQSPLFNGTSSGGGLDLSLTPENGDTAHQLLLDGDVVGNSSCTADASSVVTCSSRTVNVLMPVGYGNSANNGLKWTNGSTDFVQVDTYLPKTAGSQFQGSTATITLQSHAVQWKNNSTTKGATPNCDLSTVFPNGLGSNGTPCPISWS